MQTKGPVTLLESLVSWALEFLVLALIGFCGWLAWGVLLWTGVKLQEKNKRLSDIYLILIVVILPIGLIVLELAFGW